MRYITEEVNNAIGFLKANRSAEMAEIESVLANTLYHVQFCGQKGRTSDLIFSPSQSNTAIENAFIAAGWEAGVSLTNPGYDTGRNIDFYKNGVAIEVQFSHYGLCMTDISRMERLFTRNLHLHPSPEGTLRPVVAGVEIVIDRSMPASQSVTHMDILRTRGAPIAQKLPLLMVGILPPQSGDSIILHNLVPRSRKSTFSQLTTWK